MPRRVFAALLILGLVLALPLQANATSADLQARLAKSDAFLAKVENLIVVQARAVKLESAGTANHAARAAYADQVFANSASHAIKWAVYLAGSTNVAGTITNNDDGTVSTSATDAAVLSQIATDWNLFAVAG